MVAMGKPAKNARAKGVIEKLVPLLVSAGAKKITLFGSYARNEGKKGSDIDVIVDFGEPKSLLELVEIEQDASKKLGVKLDLLTEKAVSPYIAGRIERVVLYGA
jgi:predicted nucleotidyltransferase